MEGQEAWEYNTARAGEDIARVREILENQGVTNPHLAVSESSRHVLVAFYRPFVTSSLKSCLMLCLEACLMVHILHPQNIAGEACLASCRYSQDAL